MSSRRPRRNSKPQLSLCLHGAGWDVAAVAAIDHCSLPWYSQQAAATVTLDAEELGQFRCNEKPQALSLLGQFAAHQAFLRFAGMSDSGFDPAQWAVVAARGEDPRLIRTSAATCTFNSANELAGLDLVQQFADYLSIDCIDSLREPWGKPEAVFAEVDVLTGEMGAPKVWLRASACGFESAPGTSALRSLLEGRTRVIPYDDAPEILRVGLYLRALAPDSVAILGEAASPLDEFSAVRSLDSVIGPPAGRTPAAFAEAVAQRAERSPLLLVMVGEDLFDSRSREVRKILLSQSGCSWLLPRALAPAAAAGPVDEREGGRTFILSRWLSPLRTIADRLSATTRETRERWLPRWVHTSGYDEFLSHGTVPDLITGTLEGEITEPHRSFLAALAIGGSRLPLSAARELLPMLGSDLPVESLVFPGATSIEGEEFVFVDHGVREFLQKAIPNSARPTLTRLVGELLDRQGLHGPAARLLLPSDVDRARDLLEGVAASLISSGDDIVSLLEAFPQNFIESSPILAGTLASAWLARGLYRKAISISAFASEEGRALLAAKGLRRMGSYASALSRLLDCSRETFETSLLRGELLRLTGNQAESEIELTRARSMAEGNEQLAIAGYQSALLDLDRSRPASTTWMNQDERGYFSARFNGYEALQQSDYERATVACLEASALASVLPEMIDAALDQLYVHFESGAWDAARHQARVALSLVEDTEGDRAAGGILFTLAYLCADDGQFSQSREKIKRLRHFYAANNDERRQRELALLEAHLAFAEGRHEVARSLADEVLTENFGSDIREAAALIVDELDWIGCFRNPLRSNAGSSRELIERHLLQRARREGSVPPEMRDGFNRELAQFEIDRIAGGTASIPDPNSGSEVLRLLRSLRGLVARSPHPDLSEALIRCCAKAGVECDLSVPSAERFSELEVIQRVASAEFPFATLTDLRWRFATRNRFGRWSEIGSLAALDDIELDRQLAKPGTDWTVCSSESLLYLAELSRWSFASRGALAELFRVRAENHYLRRAAAQEEFSSIADAQPPGIEGWVGASPVMLEVMARVRRVAAREVPVCILGESGTGKELVALAVHRLSVRRSRPFTPVNCAALPENLVESQLFGHVRGAFTGADRDRMGLIEATEGGTLFLDEIGELSFPVQAKLLRFLQEKEFRPVGDTARRQADVRVLAATNRKLEQAVDEGTFREDLYYRINVLDLHIPPLRDRGADILLLARHFLDQENSSQRVGPTRLSEDVQLLLSAYRWPGNVRELQNTIRAAHAIAGDAREVKVEHLPEKLQNVFVVRGPAGSYFEELDRFRRSLIERSLEQTSGNQNQAAKLLGMSRQALAYQIRELGIRVK